MRDLAPVGDRLGTVGEAERDVIEDAEMGKEREALKDEADAAPVGLDREQRAAIDQDIAAVGRLEAREDPDQRRLAGTAGAQDGDVLARLGGEADRAKHRVAVIGLGDVAYFEKRSHVFEASPLMKPLPSRRLAGLLPSAVTKR